MKNPETSQSSRVLRPVRLGLATGLAVLLVGVLLWGLRGVSWAHASPGTLYVDGATGGDTGDCQDSAAPCQTIGYAIAQAVNGDTIRVAQGTYTENLSISKPVTLTGGYEATNWSRDITRYETVIDGSGSQPIVGDWDGRQVMKPAVIRDGAEYKMWFDGMNLLAERQIGLATSSDGISWIKHPTNPVLSGTPGAWDESGEHAPFVLKEGGVYKMWYEGNDGGVHQPGYATSTNGIDWQKHAGNPVLAAGPLLPEGGSWDYHLLAWSPAIDAGTPVGAPAADLDGTPRDAAPDMGAYEWRFRIFLPLVLRNLGSQQ